MAGFITLAQAIMGATGGVPVQPAGANTIIEKLRAAKSMLPGDIGNVLGKVLNEGPGSILQNPVGALTGQLQGQVGGMLSQIQGLASGSGLNLQGMLGSITGATGLQSVLSRFQGATNALSGLGGTTAGGFSLMDAIGHANISTILGPAMTQAVGINTAMGPIMMGPNLQAISSQLTSISGGITNRTINDAAGAAQIASMTAQLTRSLDASDNAFATVQAAIVPIAQTTGLISMIASGPPEMAVIANMLIQEAHKAEIQAALDEQIRA
jgi:hypothetical protein